MEKVCLGKVVKLHGYLGQMKVQTEYDKDFDANKIKEIANENDDIFKVSRIFKNADGVVVKLEGVELEDAKTYIGKMLYIDRSVLEGKILFEDLKGSVIIFESGEELGKIVDVQDYGTAEVFFVMKEARAFRKIAPPPQDHESPGEGRPLGSFP